MLNGPILLERCYWVHEKVHYDLGTTDGGCLYTWSGSSTGHVQNDEITDKVAIVLRPQGYTAQMEIPIGTYSQFLESSG